MNLDALSSTNCRCLNHIIDASFPLTIDSHLRIETLIVLHQLDREILGSLVLDSVGSQLSDSELHAGEPLGSDSVSGSRSLLHVREVLSAFVIVNVDDLVFGGLLLLFQFYQGETYLISSLIRHKRLLDDEEVKIRFR